MRIKEVNQCHAVVENNEIHTINQLLSRFSNWSQLIRSMAYIRRFINNVTTKNKIFGNLSVSELDTAELTIIRYVQQREFVDDINSLTKTKRILSSSKLISLAPFLDSQNILRVGGRLEHANCSYDMKHPIIIPRDHPITTKILQYIHKTYLHPGPTLLTAISRHKYWILGIREKCRKLCHDCTTCFRYSTLRSVQQMGNLPQSRITPSRPFSTVGVDYAGPIMLATKKGRGAKLIKGLL